MYHTSVALLSQDYRGGTVCCEGILIETACERAGWWHLVCTGSAAGSNQMLKTVVTAKFNRRQDEGGFGRRAYTLGVSARKPIEQASTG